MLARPGAVSAHLKQSMLVSPGLAIGGWLGSTRSTRSLTAHAQALPSRIYFWPGALTEDILTRESAVKLDEVVGHDAVI